MDRLRELLNSSEWPRLQQSFRTNDKDEIVEKLVEIYNNPITQKVLHLIEIGLYPGDAMRYEHWGETTLGKVVLLDYGATNEVYKKHYTVDYGR